MVTKNGVELQEPAADTNGGHEEEGGNYSMPIKINVIVENEGNANLNDDAAHPRRLGRRDSLDAESLHVKGMSQGLYRSSLGVGLHMAFQTIGIVFGDLGTSPLYVFSSTFSSGKIGHNDDILGVLSLIIYTLILIPLIKYVFIVLRADDNGEGGTFSLYSLICRCAKIGLAHNQTPAEADISSYRLTTPTKNSARAACIKNVLKNSKWLQNILLFVVLLGPCLVIGDGSLTPAISVLSAIQGIGVQVPSLSSDKVLVSITVVVLIILFNLQRFGTQKVAFLFAPAMLVWFSSMGILGLYNIFRWDPTIFKALNPFYILSYFRRNKKEAWVSLGGVVLCITGTEAMYADLGHFNMRSIQVAFSGLVFPSLCFAYTGQAAFLTKNQSTADVEFTFYRSIPKTIFWPMFAVSTMAAIIASQAMISATYSMIRNAMALGCFPRLSVIHTSTKVDGQIYIPEINWILMILSVSIVAAFRSTTQIGNAYGIAVVGVFLISTCLLTLVMAMVWEINIYLTLAFLAIAGTVESFYLSSVLSKVVDGGWVPLAIATCFMLIMFSWNYGTRLKYTFEFSQRLSMDWVLGLGKSLGIARVPGIGLVYTEVPQGVPAIFAHGIANLPAIHSVLVFVCIRNLPVSTVPEEERILIRRLGPIEYRMFRCVVRYGYTDHLGLKAASSQNFEELLLRSLQSFVKHELAAGRMSQDSTVVASPSILNGHSNTPEYSVSITVRDDDTDISEGGQLPDNLSTANVSPSATEIGDEAYVQNEVQFLQHAREAGVVYLLGENEVLCKEGASIFKRFLIDYVYSFCRRNCRKNTVSLGIPRERLLKVGMTYQV